MRKVKVVAASFLCFAVSGALGGVVFSDENSMPVANSVQRDLIAPLTAESATTQASIETTITTETSVRKTTAATTAATTEVTKLTSKSTASTTKTTATVSTTKESTTTTETTTAAVSSADVQYLSADFYSAETLLPEDYEAEATETVTTVWTDPQPETWTAAAPVTEAPAQPASGIPAGITEREYIMLCNVVGHEYGADFVPDAEKALVVEVIMNRVHSAQFPNSIHEVLTQRNQFSGIEYYVELETYSSMVTESVKRAVNLYFADPSQFAHGYLFFNGDGTRNYFRTSY